MSAELLLASSCGTHKKNSCRWSTDTTCQPTVIIDPRANAGVRNVPINPSSWSMIDPSTCCISSPSVVSGATCRCILHFATKPATPPLQTRMNGQFLCPNVCSRDIPQPITKVRQQSANNFLRNSIRVFQPCRFIAAEIFR